VSRGIEVSVIIPTYNRARFLPDALAGILNQSFPADSYEIILIDNGSTDNTRQTVEEINRNNAGRVSYIYEPRPGLMVGRHLGARLAKGHILLYGDDDIIVPADWVKEMYRCYQDKEVGAASGKVLPKFEVRPPAWINLFTRNYISIVDAGDEYRIVTKNLAAGCNMSIRKDVFYEVGGSYPDSMPPDLIRFAGTGESGLMEKVEQSRYKIVYNPRAYVHHVIPASRLTIESYKKRAFLQGVSDSYRLIREQGKIEDAAYAGALRPPAWSTRLHRLLRCLKHGRARALTYYRYFNEVEAAHQAGLRYHRAEAAQDPALLRWVLKENYLDERDWVA